MIVWCGARHYVVRAMMMSNHTKCDFLFFVFLLEIFMKTVSYTYLIGKFLFGEFIKRYECLCDRKFKETFLLALYKLRKEGLELQYII